MSDKKPPNWNPTHTGWIDKEAQKRATRKSILARDNKKADAALRKFSFEDPKE